MRYFTRFMKINMTEFEGTEKIKSNHVAESLHTDHKQNPNNFWQHTATFGKIRQHMVTWRYENPPSLYC